MHDLFGCRLSAGTIANIVRECADELVETELKIKQQLRRSSVIHADETGLRINKRLGYVHVGRWACGVRHARVRYPMASTTSEVI